MLNFHRVLHEIDSLKGNKVATFVINFLQIITNHGTQKWNIKPWISVVFVVCGYFPICLFFVRRDIFFSCSPGDKFKKNIETIINEMKCNIKIIIMIKMALANKRTFQFKPKNKLTVGSARWEIKHKVIMYGSKHNPFYLQLFWNL